ncbi:MAG: PAS domain S-box protein [Gammaproteobacteria bacterium]|jgi:two-component system sensor kinase FixL|nr:PAS domain S-box protein [Gammaproteobacteria bacterium]
MSESGPRISLISSAIQLDAILDAMVESLIVIDEHGVIVQVNDSTLNMFGYDRSELISANISKLMVGADRLRHDQYLSRYRKTGEKRIIGKGREVQALRKDGTEFPAEIAVGESMGGARPRYVGLIRDLTEQRRAEESALQQREEMISVSRLSLMGEMTAAMAHELNQPLTAVANYAAASKRLLEDPSAENLQLVRETLDEIGNQAHRAGRVIARTRGFTRSADGERVVMTLADINQQIKRLAEVDTNANNINIAWDIPPELPAIEVDPVEIQQVMLNLVRNAVDAMANTPAASRNIRVTARRSGPHELRYEVCDHGCGVDSEVSDSVFNAFFTTKPLGMGMGLAICRTIIRKHGGELGFRNNDANNLSSGSTFYFTLPTQVTR